MHDMQDARWFQLERILVDSGWSWRDDALYAPHETIWFQPNCDNPNYAGFRDRMTHARDATATAAQHDLDHAELYADLSSLVAALDAVLTN